MKRIVGNYGIVLVVLISSTKGHSRITLGLLAKVILHIHLLKVLIKKRRIASLAPMKMNSRVDEKITKGFQPFIFLLDLVLES